MQAWTKLHMSVSETFVSELYYVVNWLLAYLNINLRMCLQIACTKGIAICEMAQKEGSRVGCGDLIWLPLSVQVCLGLVVEYWPFVGACTHHSYSKLHYLCLLSSLIKLLPPPTPPPHPSCPPPNIHWPNIMTSIKKIEKSWRKPAIVYLSD